TLPTHPPQRSFFFQAEDGIRDPKILQKIVRIVICRQEQILAPLTLPLRKQLPERVPLIFGQTGCPHRELNSTTQSTLTPLPEELTGRRFVIRAPQCANVTASNITID